MTCVYHSCSFQDACDYDVNKANADNCNSVHREWSRTCRNGAIILPLGLRYLKHFFGSMEGFYELPNNRYYMQEPQIDLRITEFPAALSVTWLDTLSGCGWNRTKTTWANSTKESTHMATDWYNCAWTRTEWLAWARGPSAKIWILQMLYGEHKKKDLMVGRMSLP